MGKSEIAKYKAQQKLREATAKQRKANVIAFYAAVEKLEREIGKLGDAARPPRRGDRDLRFILTVADQRHLSDAVASLRRVRDEQIGSPRG